MTVYLLSTVKDNENCDMREQDTNRRYWPTFDYIKSENRVFKYHYIFLK